MYMNNMKELYIYVPSLKFCSVKSISNCLQSSVCNTCPHVKQIHLSTKTVHILLHNKLAVLPKISSSDSVKFWHIIKFKNCIVLKLRSRLWYFFDKLSIIAVIFLLWLTDPQQAASTIAMQKASVRDVLIRMSPCTSTWISTKALSLIWHHKSMLIHEYLVNAFQRQTPTVIITCITCFSENKYIKKVIFWNTQY